MTRGLHLCADCYWDAEEEWRHRRVEARWAASEEEVQYIFPGEPEYDDSHEEEYSEEDSQADYPPTKKEILECGGALRKQRHRKAPEPPSSNAASSLDDFIEATYGNPAHELYNSTLYRMMLDAKKDGVQDEPGDHRLYGVCPYRDCGCGCGEYD